MTKIDDNTSKTLVLLRLPLAFLIVSGHTNILMFPIWNRNGVVSYNYSIITYPVHFLSQVLFSPAVPLFFLISGYLFFMGIDNYTYPIYKQKIKKRIKTLFLPYCVWNLLYLVPTVIMWISKGGDYSLWYFLESIWIMPNQEGRIAAMTMATPADPPLWFVRDLMVCMVISPVIWYVIKKKWINYVLLLFIAIPWIAGTSFLFPFPGISFCSILFFSVGSLLAITKVEVGRLLQNKPLYIITMSLFVILAIVDLYTISYYIGDTGAIVDQLPYVSAIEAIDGCLLYSMITSRIALKRSVDNTKWGGHFLYMPVIG